jgi:hypothetical protein
VFSLGRDHTNKKNGMTPMRSKPLLKKKCIVKTRNFRGTCNKKTNIVCPPKRKIKLKKVILIKKFKCVARPQQEINVIAPQGAQGIPGPQGVQGIPGPQGIQGIPGPREPIIIPIVNSMISVSRYLYIANSDIALPTDIPANQFTNDDDEPITEFTDLDQSSYANLYINGIMQMGESYRVNPSALTILDNNNTIFAGTPIILETVQLSVQFI